LANVGEGSAFAVAFDVLRPLLPSPSESSSRAKPRDLSGGFAFALNVVIPNPVARLWRTLVRDLLLPSLLTFSVAVEILGAEIAFARLE
jgi:hypothetical protein